MQDESSKRPGYSRRSGVRLVDTMLARGQRIFHSGDAVAIARELGIPQATVPRVLHELAAAGWVRHPRRDLYLIDETHRGGAAPHPFAVATALIEPSAISHWSALAHHGLTEQVPRMVTATTTRDLVTPRMRRSTLHRGAQDTQGRAAVMRGRPPSHDSASTWDVGGLKVQYIRVQPERFWGIEDVWVDEFSRVRITDRERTVLDGFVAPDVFGSLHEIVGALEEHLLEIDMPRLVEYALRYGQGAAIKRLGYVLEQLDVDETVLRPLQEAPIRGYRLLDPQGQVQGPHIARWHIRDNIAA